MENTINPNGRHVLTQTDFENINSTETSFLTKVKWFFKHVYYMSLAKPSPERNHYRSAFKQFETLANKNSNK